MPTLFPVICEECGQGFMVRPYRVGVAKFCSRNCNGRFYARQRDMKALGNTFEAGNKLRQGLRPTNAFTSEQVRGANNPKWKEPIYHKCKQCGVDFEVKRWKLKQPRVTGSFCSNECSSLYRHDNFSGANSPHWVGGIKTYRGRNWQKVRLLVVEVQSGNCADCGRHIGKSLPIHHFKPFREFRSAQEANAVENLIGLCQSCHMHREHPRQTV